MTKSEHFSNPGRRLEPCGTRYFADLGEVGDMPGAPRAPHNEGVSKIDAPSFSNML